MSAARAVTTMLRDDSGATMVEYAIVLALLSAVGLAVITALTSAANSTFSAQQAGLQSAQTSP